MNERGGFINKLAGIEAYNYELAKSGKKYEALSALFLQLAIPLSERHTRDSKNEISPFYFFPDIASVFAGTFGVVIGTDGDIKKAGVLLGGKIVYNITAHALSQSATKIRRRKNNLL